MKTKCAVVAASMLLAFSFLAHAQNFGPTPITRLRTGAVACADGQTLLYNNTTKQFDSCGSTGGAANVTASSVSAVTSLALNVSSLNLASVGQAIVQCWSGSGAPFSPVAITSLNPASTSSITANFASTANVTCRVNGSGGAGPQGPSGAVGPAGLDGTNGAISQIQDEGIGLPVQPIIDFQGTGVTATNGSGKTVVTIAAGGNYQTIKVNGAAQTQRSSVNYNGGIGIAVSAVDASPDTNINFTLDTSAVLTNRNAQLGTPFNCSASGTTSLICTITPAPVCSDITTAGWTVRVIPASTNTGAVTLAANGCTAISLLNSTGSALLSGALVSGRPYTFVSDGTNLIQQGGSSGGGIGTAGSVNLAPSGANDVVQSGMGPWSGGAQATRVTQYAATGLYGLQFDNSNAGSDPTTYATIAIPSDFNFSGAMTLSGFVWDANNNETNLTVQVAVGCVGPGDSVALPTFNANATATAASVGSATFFGFTTASISYTGCAAGELMSIRLSLDRTSANKSTSIRMAGLKLNYVRQ